MFRLINKLSGSESKNSTFKPVKQHKAGSKREEIHEYTKKTLGRFVKGTYIFRIKFTWVKPSLFNSGNMRAVVQLPPGEDLNEWLAANSKIAAISRTCFLFV